MRGGGFEAGKGLKQQGGKGVKQSDNFSKSVLGTFFILFTRKIKICSETPALDLKTTLI